MLEAALTIKDLDLNSLDKMGVKYAGDPQRIYKGKVRDIIDFGSKLFIYTTDRISAFDRVLATIPYKGEMLNQLSLFWFKQTEDIIDNHIIKEVSPRSVLVKKCSTIPVEVVVRGYLTGSAWRDYQNSYTLSGIRIKQGMRRNEKFETPILTPSTKAEKGVHDMPISREKIINRGIVEKNLWKKIENTALTLFKRGASIAEKQGLILVDTKYEFGISNDKLFVIDEIHTQDSSRYWYKDTYKELFDQGKEQRKLDKEFFRKWLMDRGYMGNGTPPDITEEIKKQIADKYKENFRIITGRDFKPSVLTQEEQLEEIANELKMAI